MDDIIIERNKLDFIKQLDSELSLKFISKFKEGLDPFSDKSLMEQTEGLTIQNFNAIDFETANECPSSICSIGIVAVRDGKVSDTFYSLVHPEPEYYKWFCQKVHGLGPEDTDNAPCFEIAWNNVTKHISTDGYPFIAHNARFDEGCLKAALGIYKIDYSNYKFLDTLKASRKHFGRSLPNHQLQTVATACGYDLKKHHHALADAEACAAIALKILPISELL